MFSWVRNCFRPSGSPAPRRFRPRLEALDTREVPATVKFAGAATAEFVSPTPASAVVSGVGTDHFTWGRPNDDVGPSTLAFKGANWSAAPNRVFSLGTLTYFNGTVYLDSVADTVDFQTNVEFKSPAGVTPQSQPFTFRFGLINTQNVDGDPRASADFVVLANRTDAEAQVITDAEGKRWRLQLVGFGTIRGEGFKTVDRFHVMEGEDASAQVLGRLVSDVDLTAKVDNDHIVPAKATDLHLLSMFGGEQVQVPVTIKNQGRDTATGRVDLKVFLSASPKLDKNAIPIGSLPKQQIDLAPQGEQDFTVTVKVPGGTRLKPGEKYYVLAQVTPVGFLEIDATADGVGENNTGASSDRYEFLGTPKANPKVFSNGTYFGFVRDFLKGKNPAGIPHPEFFQRDSIGGFIAAFEGKVPYPYKVAGKGNTTIGIGMELPSLIGMGMLPDLKASVQTFATAHGDTSWANLTDKQFVQRLNAQATRKDETPIMSMESVDALFAKFVKKYEEAAQKVLDKYGVSPIGYQWVALVDVQYNMTGGLNAFPSMMKALAEQDVMRAVFQLVDARRTTQFPGLTTRTAAELGNLLFTSTAEVGNLVP